MKKLVMEFLGTFFFVLTISFTGIPTAIATMLMAWVYIGYYVSGSHYNPMISLALALRGAFAWRELGGYIIAQILGSTAAFFLSSHLNNALALGVELPHPNPQLSLLQIFVIEVLLAFVLAFIVLVVTSLAQFNGSQVYGLAIGFTIPALAYLGKKTSGGIYNPAVAIGASIVALFKGLPFSLPYLLVYVAGAFLGGILAAFAYMYFYGREDEEIVILKF